MHVEYLDERAEVPLFGIGTQAPRCHLFGSYLNEILPCHLPCQGYLKFLDHVHPQLDYKVVNEPSNKLADLLG